MTYVGEPIVERFNHSRSMKSPTEPTLVLDYHQPPRSRRLRRWLLFPLGAIPFIIELIAITCEALTGDPPNNLSEFKAYHYSIAVAVLIGFCWLLLVGRTLFKRRRWWVLLLAVAWFAWVCWVGVWFLRELNAHPAAEYYWDLWRQ
jgi:hypothetical protein